MYTFGHGGGYYPHGGYGSPPYGYGGYGASPYGYAAHGAWGPQTLQTSDRRAYPGGVGYPYA